MKRLCLFVLLLGLCGCSKATHKPVPVSLNNPQVVRLAEFAATRGLKWNVFIPEVADAEYYCAQVYYPGHVLEAKTECDSDLKVAIDLVITDPWRLEGGPQ
jgi:hypothetical protein